MTSQAAVHDEVIVILALIDPEIDPKPVRDAFLFTENLYHGRFSGYKACNADYHDFRHITDTYLAMARLIHGAVLEGEVFSRRYIILGLISALLHDSGMISQEGEPEGPGGRYVKEHVQRSMDFAGRHAAELGVSLPEVEIVRTMILCTDLAADISAIHFSSPAVEMLGKMLATADLLGQMADRNYLEKLLFLFHEFREAEMGEARDEIDFLHNTLHFYEFCDQRFNDTLAETCRFMVPHFHKRWNIPYNLYLDSLNKQRAFLRKILADHHCSPYEQLKRSDIVEKVRGKFGSHGLKEG
ncbi:MAG: hypothetical protein ACLFV2_06860 [Desulfurivibrionaceae bacterium]